MELTITEVAGKELKKAMEAQDKSDHGLKIGVMPGGCAGLQYSLSFLKEPTNGEIVILKDGIKLFVEPNHEPILDGLTIDYVQTLMGGGFKIENPNAHSSCGCGKSFG